MKRYHRSDFPRLDILDSIFIEYLEPDFLDFALKHPDVDAFIALGAIACGATKPAGYDDPGDVYNDLERRGHDLIEDYIDAKMKENDDE